MLKLIHFSIKLFVISWHDDMFLNWSQLQEKKTGISECNKKYLMKMTTSDVVDLISS